MITPSINHNKTNNNIQTSTSLLPTLQAATPLNQPTTRQASKPTQPYQKPKIYIQLGAFGQYQNARKTQIKVEQYIKPVFIEQYNRSSTPLFRVRIGPVSSRDKIDKMLGILQKLGYQDAHIVSKK